MTLLARPGRAIYRLLTSVRFAVVQIVAIALAGVVGIIVPQLPGVAFRSPADYAEQIAILRARVEPVAGRPADGPLRGTRPVPGLHRLVVHGAARPPRRLDRRLHAGPHAAPLALRPRRPRRPAGRASSTRTCRTGP